MKRMKTSDWAATALVASFAVGTTGCAENDSTLYVRQMQALTRDTECIIAADTGALIDVLGTFDPLCEVDDDGNLTGNCSTGPYRGFPLVGNGMVARGDGALLRAESNSVQIFGVEREVIIPGGGLLTPEIGDDNGAFSAASGFVPVGSPTQNGFGITEVVLLTQTEALSALQAAGTGDTTVLVRFKILGETLGGQEVETGVFDYPIQIRNRPGRFLSCCDPRVDLTAELEEADLPCDINQGDGISFQDPRFDPAQNFCSNAMCP